MSPADLTAPIAAPTPVVSARAVVLGERDTEAITRVMACVSHFPGAFLAPGRAASDHAA